VIRKVFRAGNSVVVSLPRECLEFLELVEGSPVSVELDREGRRLVVYPAGMARPETDEAHPGPRPRNSFPLVGGEPERIGFRYQRMVVKVGTSVLTAGMDQLYRPRMLDLVRQIADLHRGGLEVVLVTSGAIMAGRERLGFPKMGKGIPFKQVLAAVGQGHLMHLYEQMFDMYEITVAQTLLTREDMIDRQRYLNARDTLLALVRQRVVPIVNENDVVAVDEIRVGDNDNISAMVANLVEADLLVMLTDTEGLYSADPRLHPEAELISEVPVIDGSIRELAGEAGSEWGSGGMITKIEAAELATRSGTRVVVALGEEENVLMRIAQGEAIGTAFLPSSSKVESRKRWILAEGATKGYIKVDAGAARALLQEGKSLLAVGVTEVSEGFGRGETVRILDEEGREIARGLTRYAAADLKLIKGARSDRIEDILGYEYGSEVVHRNDLMMLQKSTI